MRYFPKTSWLVILFVIFFLVAGFFAYQWWQVKGELVKKIEENESLIRQVDELQKEIRELKVSKKEVIDETIGWETYRNEEYGFEIDYLVDGWEFTDRRICRISTSETQKDEKFCIGIGIEFLYPDCYDYSWEEIFASGVYTKEYPGGEDCILGRNRGGKFEKEITTNFGVKGHKGRMNFPHSWNCNIESEVIVYFLLKGEVKRNERSYRPLLGFSYFDCPTDFDFGKKEIEIFDKIVSTFRFIEK